MLLPVLQPVGTPAATCFSPGALVPGIELDVIVSGSGGQPVVVGAGALGNPGSLVGPNRFTGDSAWNFSPEIHVFDTVFNRPIAAAASAIGEHPRTAVGLNLTR